MARRALVARPGVLADGALLPHDLDAIDASRLLEALAAGEPLDGDALQELCAGGPPAVVETSLGGDAGGRACSVATAVRTGELLGRELDAAAYEVVALHCVEEDAAGRSLQRRQLLQALRRAAGLSRRGVSHIEALARSAKDLEREFEETAVPDRGSLEYRLFLCRCAACWLQRVCRA